MARRGARIEQSRREVERCEGEFATWMKRRRSVDSKGQYASQLAAVEDVIEESTGLMRSELDAIAPAGPHGEVYEACLRIDRQLAWTRRLWAYFREKWDQRDDVLRGPVLAAAEEIVWSSYVPPFRQLDRPPGPAPLPYVSTDLSARAVPRRRLPQDLHPGHELLFKTVERLPVPVVGIPEICVANPWWLILLPHEVGHQVAFELDDGRLPGRVGAVLATAARRGGAALDGSDWSAWAHELFADAFAGAMVGAAHLWALVELEQGVDAALVRRFPGYPPPIVRQAVAAELLSRWGLSRAEALPALPAQPALDELEIAAADREHVQRQLAAVGAVAEALAAEPILDGKSLRDLLPPRPKQFSRSGRVGDWQRELAGSAEARPEAVLEAARLATAGAFAEWADAMEEPDLERRRAQQDLLRSRMLEVVANSREPGTRAAEEAAGSANLGREVALEAMALAADESTWTGDMEPYPESVPV